MSIQYLDVSLDIEGGSLVVRVQATNEDWSLANGFAALSLDELAKALAERAQGDRNE